MLGRGWRLLAALTMGSLLVSSGGTVSAQPGDAPVEIKVIIRYETRPGPRERVRLRTDNDARIRFTYRNVDAVAASIPRGQLRALRARPNVQRVELDHPLMLFDHGPATGDPELEATWGVEHIGAARVHQSGNQGNPIRVAVIDTGIDCGHPDLDANCVGGVSYIPGTTSFDDYGHGTHVAGTVAAEKNGVGSSAWAPQVELFAMKVLDASGQGDYSGLIAALDQVTTWNGDADPGNDVDVVNMSLGGHDVSTTLEFAVAAAHASGAILVAATGNVNPFDWTSSCTAARWPTRGHIRRSSLPPSRTATTR